MKRIITMVAAALCTLGAATSCLENEEDSVLIYGYTAIGNMKDGALLTDYGQTFHILQKECEGSLDTCSRVIVYCDILKQLDDAGNEYNIKVRSFTCPLVAEPIAASTAGEVVSDPVEIAQGWLSGGYINVNYRHLYAAGTGVKHTVSLLYDDVKSNADTLYYTLKHNAFGETTGGGKYTLYDLSMKYGYASFPFTQHVPYSAASITVCLSWDWYTTDESGNILNDIVLHNSDCATYFAQ